MKRYRAIAGTWDHSLGDMIHMPDSITVHSSDKDPRYTGLFDANGTPIYEVPTTIPVGFHRKA